MSIYTTNTYNFHSHEASRGDAPLLFFPSSKNYSYPTIIPNRVESIRLSFICATTIYTTEPTEQPMASIEITCLNLMISLFFVVHLNIQKYFDIAFSMYVSAPWFLIDFPFSKFSFDNKWIDESWSNLSNNKITFVWIIFILFNFKHIFVYRFYIVCE